MSYQFKGNHYIASFKGIKPICNFDLKNIVSDALITCGINILNYQEYIFNNNAISFCFLLSESHCSLHSYPEYNSLFIDCFTCGDDFDLNRFHNILLRKLRPDDYTKQIIERN